MLFCAIKVLLDRLTPRRSECQRFFEYAFKALKQHTPVSQRAPAANSCHSTRSSKSENLCDESAYLKIDDGNADDKSVFVERLKEFKNQWTFDGICVADSEAIGMIMGLCLLVYNRAQRKLRQQLSATNDRVKNQVKKLTDKPTMRWIFQVFQAVHVVTINGEKQVSNLTCLASGYLATFRRVLLSID